MAQESAQEEGTDIRRKAAVRLGIAAVVTVLALGALWWLDRSGKEKPKPKPATPAPIVSAPSPTPPATPVEPAPPAPEPEPGREPPIEEIPPPPPPSPALSQPAPARPAPAPAVAARRPATAVMQPAPPAQPPGKPAAAPSGGSYVVQLGVFSNPKNAQELVDRLTKLGIRAYTETRVHVGPFLNKAEADKAQAELKRLGINGLVGSAGTTK